MEIKTTFEYLKVLDSIAEIIDANIKQHDQIEDAIIGTTSYVGCNEDDICVSGQIKINKPFL